MTAVMRVDQHSRNRAEQVEHLRRKMAEVSGRTSGSAGSSHRGSLSSHPSIPTSETLLPVPESLSELLPDSLPRGTVAVLSGVRSLPLRLVAAVTAAGGHAAIVGHVFPMWFGFRGGKGGATAAGLVLYLAPSVGIAVIAVWLLVVALTGFVGLATICAGVAAVAVIGWTLMPAEPGLFAFACCTAALLVYTHRGNIRRMLNGTSGR